MEETYMVGWQITGKPNDPYYWWHRIFW